MSFAKNQLGLGISAGAAHADVIATIASGISAAGTTQGTATTISADCNLVSAAAANSGVILYNGDVSDTCFVFNDGTGNGFYVYPPVGSKINNLGTNSGMPLANNTGVMFLKVTATRWLAILSA